MSANVSAKQPRVAIVGAGIAGLVTAALLSADGIECQVFERVPAFDPIGAGIQIAPNGARILRRLGLGDLLRTRGVEINAIEFLRWDDGRLLSRTGFGAECEALFGASYFTIHRGDLHRGLVSLVSPEIIHMGHDCAGLTQAGDGVRLDFSGADPVTADVVIGADGVHSALRAALIADAPEFSGHVVYRGLVPAESVPILRDEPKVIFWIGPGHHVTCYPVADGELVHFSAVVPADERDTGERDTGALADMFAGWQEAVTGLVTAADSVGRWGLYDRPLADRWGEGRATLVGDAAHPILPYISQGANQALEDAVTLAACLRQAGPVPAALRQYEALRLPRVTEVFRQSRERGRIFHYPDGAAQRDRDRDLRDTQHISHLAWLYGDPHHSPSIHAVVS